MSKWQQGNKRQSPVPRKLVCVSVFRWGSVAGGLLWMESGWQPVLCLWQQNGFWLALGATIYITWVYLMYDVCLDIRNKAGNFWSGGWKRSCTFKKDGTIWRVITSLQLVVQQLKVPPYIRKGIPLVPTAQRLPWIELLCNDSLFCWKETVLLPVLNEPVSP